MAICIQMEPTRKIRNIDLPAEPQCCQKSLQDPLRWQACIGSNVILCMIVFIVNVALIFCVSLIIVAYVNIKLGPRDDTTRRVVCYYRWKINSLEPSAVSTSLLCTHLILSFATVGSDFQLNLTDVGGIAGVKQVINEIRKKTKIRAREDSDLFNSSEFRSVRVMLSVGGGGGNAHFAEMVGSHDNRNVFLKSCAEVIRITALDGLDFDWEFPGFRDRGQLATLLRDTSAMLSGIASNQSDPFELSIAIPGPFTLALGFDVREISRYCSFVNLMAYDLVLLNSVFRQTALHSALHAQPSWWYIPFAVDFTVSFWLMLGLTRPMINLGIPTYGVGYELTNKYQTGLFSSVKGYLRMGANVNYETICEIAKSQPIKTHRHEASGAPFIDDSNGTWISFDDPISITKKVEYARTKGLGGIMIFSLNADDHAGKCGQQQFPLTMTAVKNWRISTSTPVRLNRTNESIVSVPEKPYYTYNQAVG
ncbi:chitinase-3-like protein 1 isoform X1 [Varroa jacobsoni]|uniref:chitinase-3-like protein 1 isoform X1 n=2 Tax=Varroa jacobsoni TaxID=62625 RepID=UPI000BF6A80A|nr:chitinase-3-like protein 1 isoform X1 [Varroa jacobsoni]